AGNPTSATEGDAIAVVFSLSHAPTTNNSFEVLVTQPRNLIPAAEFIAGTTIAIDLRSSSASTEVTLMVTLDNDGAIGGGGNIVLTISPTATHARGSYLVGSPSALTIAVADAGGTGPVTPPPVTPPPVEPPPPPPTVTIAANASAVDEGELAVFTITAAHPDGSALRGTLTVAISLTSTGDFFGVPADVSGTSTVELSASSPSAMLSLDTDDDEVDETDGSVTATLPTGDSTYTVGTPNTATITIRDDDDPALGAEQIVAVNAAILPQVGASLGDQATNAFSDRVAAAFNNNQQLGLSLQGASPMQFLANQAQSRTNAYARGQRAAPLQLPGNIGFAMALNQPDSFAEAGGGGSAAPDNIITLWGRTFREDISGTKGKLDEQVSLDGKMDGVMVGLDAMSSGLLWGVGLVRAESEIDFDSNGIKGVHDTSISGLHPYAGIQREDGTRLWGTLGFDRGDIEISEAAGGDGDTPATRYSSDVTIQTIGFGGYSPFMNIVSKPGNSMQAGFIGDGMFVRTREDGGNAMDVNNSRLRLGVELNQSAALGSSNLASSLEVVWRHDLGDGFTGGGAEVAIGADLIVPNSNFLLGIDAHSLLYHDGGLEGWGVGINLAWAARRDNRGLSLSFRPQWNAVETYGLELKYGLPILNDKELLQLFARGNLATLGNTTTSLGASFNLGESFSAGYEAVMGQGGAGSGFGSGAVGGGLATNSPTPGNPDYISRHLQPGTASHQYFTTGSSHTSPLQKATNQSTTNQSVNHSFYIRYHKRF
ncbi:MAG: hypothetical protein ACR2PR_02005, partial [Pseudohongiellaceae bacterium]